MKSQEVKGANPVDNVQSLLKHKYKSSSKVEEFLRVPKTTSSADLTLFPIFSSSHASNGWEQTVGVCVGSQREDRKCQDKANEPVCKKQHWQTGWKLVLGIDGTNGDQDAPIRPNWSDASKLVSKQNLWKSMKICENLSKSMKIHENLRKSMKINENLWKSMKIYENLWKPMKIYKNLWKSMEIYENPTHMCFEKRRWVIFYILNM